MGKAFVWLLWCILPVLWCRAQVGLNNVRSITVEDGLPQGWVFDMVQDKQGFVWLAANGLYRYDGRNFVRFMPVSAAQTALLKGGELRWIQPDNQNNLWLTFTSGHIFRINTLTGQLKDIRQDAAARHLVSKEYYTIVCKAGQYFAVRPSSLLRYDPATGNNHSIPLPPGETLVSIGSNAGKQVFISTTRAFYQVAGNALHLLFRYAVAAPQEQQVVDSVARVQFIPTGKIVENRMGQVLVAVANGIYLYDPQSQQARFQPIPGHNYQIRQLVATKSGMVYFCLEDGLYQMAADGSTPYRVIDKATMPLYYPMIEDKAGLLWAATSSATGIRLFSTRPPNFRSFAYQNGFSHDVLEPWLHNPMKGYDFGSYGFRCTKDNLGRVWVIANVVKGMGQFTSNISYVYRLNRTDARLISFDGRFRPMSIAFNAYGQCWMVLKDKTEYYLVKADVVNNSYSLFTRLYDFPSENGYLTCIGNRVVVMQSSTLLLFDTTGRLQKTLPREVLSNDALLMTAPDPHHNDRLWFATKGSGIIRFNLATGQKNYYNESNGLPNNTVYFLAPDKNGLFWCSSNKGIFRFDPKTAAITPFTAEDGLQGNEFNRYHFLETPDGHFIFGGTNGYNVFHPDSVQVDRFTPPAVLSEVLVNNKPLGHTIAAYSDKITSSLSEVRLAYNQNFLTFSFSGLEYSAPEKLHYQYMLEGFDKSWITAGADASAKYTSVPPGQYTFKVRVANTSGIWNRNVKSVAVIIRPPWWKTGWAYCGYILLLGGLGYAAWRNWQQREKTRREIFLQQKEAEQLKAVDAIKNRFFDNITHEFRTPLTLILAPLETIQNSEASTTTKRELQGVERNARRLLQLINQLLDLAKLEASSMKPELSTGNLAEFIRSSTNGFQPQAKAKNIALAGTILFEEGNYLFDNDKLQKIIQNLLSNAIKFTPAAGEVQLQASIEKGADKEQLHLTVADNGVGIAPEKMPFIFNRFYQAGNGHTGEYTGTGIGLALVKELTELMGGRIEATHPAGQQGTVFNLWLPVEAAAGQTVVRPVVDTDVPVFSDNESSISNASDSETVVANAADTRPVILITEDDAELNAFITATFRQHYQVLTAANGKAGLAIARSELPDLIISDARMPEMDGFAFCKAIKEEAATSHIAFILLTAKAARNHVIEGLQSQADDYITKPFMVSELTLRMRNLLNRQQLLRTYFNKQLTRPEEPLQTQPVSNPFLQQLYNYVEQHLDDPNLTVENIAKAVSMSQRTLTRKLGTLAGITPVELLKQYRLKKAAELLLSGASVAEAAYKAGYETATYFSTSFKGFYGVTPTEYTKQKR